MITIGDTTYHEDQLYYTSSRFFRYDEFRVIVSGGPSLVVDLQGTDPLIDLLQDCSPPHPLPITCELVEQVPFGYPPRLWVWNLNVRHRIKEFTRIAVDLGARASSDELPKIYIPKFLRDEKIEFLRTICHRAKRQRS